MREKRYSKDMKGHMNTIQKATEEQIINGLAINLRQMEPYMLKLTGKAYQEINQLKKLCKKYGATLEVIAKSRGYDLLTGKHDIEMMRPEEKKEKVKEIIREVFAEAGLEIKELKRGDYATLFTIEGKLII